MNRRFFIKASAAAAASLSLEGKFQRAFASNGQVADSNPIIASSLNDPDAGKIWKGWKKGQFQVHFIYTGVSESAFYIFPDGTSLLLDCGDHAAILRGKKAVQVLPDGKKHSGEWIARYVQRVNPNGNHVDYMLVSHYHNDHLGSQSFYASKDIRDGAEYCLSGFAQAAEFLQFDKAIDRAWPDFSDPLPMRDDFDGGCVAQLKSFYAYQTRHNGLKIERARLGSTDQIVPLHDPLSCKDFSVRMFCGNGRICAQDGTVTDLYAERIARENPKELNENGMSLGQIFSYGDFKLYTAGDFSDKWKLPDGSTFRIEDAVADVCPKVDVAKINHHGHNSMTPKLLKALNARVYVSCVWDQLHNLSHVMDMVSDRSIYPGERVICPGIMPAERRVADSGKAWMNDIAPASFEGGHIVLNVEPGGREYSISYLTADDESMTVRSVMRFSK